MSCGISHDYNLSIEPPPSLSKVHEIFPTDINGEAPQVSAINGGGLKVTYGQDKSIIVARLDSEQEARTYFQKQLLPKFKSEPRHFSATINGQFYAKAEGSNRKKFGWINENYAFTIIAPNERELDAIVEAFPYIERIN